MMLQANMKSEKNVMPIIDISDQNIVLCDGQSVPVALIRALSARASGRIRMEFDDGAVEEIGVTRDPVDGSVVTFTRHPRSRQATPASPVETEFRAHLTNGASSRWVNRGDAEDSALRLDGWTENGLTRKRVPAAPQADREGIR